MFGRAFTERLITQMYFPGDPLLPYDPIFNGVHDPAARQRMISTFDWSTTEQEWALGYRFDIVDRRPPGHPDGGSVTDASPSAAAVPGPTPSQTIGPFFRFGTDWLHAPDLVDPAAPGAVTLRGTVLDGDGTPVPDAMIELWQAATGRFGRYLVGPAGDFRFTVAAGGPFDVTVFARGLLNRLVTRMALAADPGADADPILALVPAERRATLTAAAEPNGAYRWDVRLQGEGETVFLAW